MLAKMSVENDFETRQMCRSPQCVSQHHLGLEGWLSPAMHFGVVSDSCELLFLQILLMCNLMYIRRQTEMCCAHVLNMLKLTDHG